MNRDYNVDIRSYDKDKYCEYEKVHTEFCKFAMNISKYASNCASLFELGRYPLSIKVLSLCFKYWIRLESINHNNVLLNYAYQVARAENHSWVKGIHYLLTLIMLNCTQSTFFQNLRFILTFFKLLYQLKNIFPHMNFLCFWSCDLICIFEIINYEDIFSESVLIITLSTEMESSENSSLNRAKNHQNRPIFG